MNWSERFYCPKCATVNSVSGHNDMKRRGDSEAGICVGGGCNYDLTSVLADYSDEF